MQITGKGMFPIGSFVLAGAKVDVERLYLDRTVC